MQARVIIEDPTEEQFREVRRQLITGTDIGTILGINPYSTPYALALEKKGLVPPREMNDSMWLGKASEPHILASFTRTMGRPVRPNKAILGHPGIEWMGATPDGFTSDPEEGLEAKLVGLNAAHDWGEPGTEDIPPVYWTQVQWYMGATGIPRWWVIGQIGTKLQNHPVERNDAIIKQMIEAAREFRERYLLTDELPEPGALDVDRVKALYPVSTTGVLEETPEIRKLVEDFAHARLDEKLAKIAKDAAQAKLEAHMGALEKLKGADYSISWKSAKDSVKTNWEAVVAEARATLPAPFAAVLETIVQTKTFTRPGTRSFRPSGALFKGEEE